MKITSLIVALCCSLYYGQGVIKKSLRIPAWGALLWAASIGWCVYAWGLL